MLDTIHRILISPCRWFQEMIGLVIARIKEFGHLLQVPLFFIAICIGAGTPLVFHWMVLPFFPPLDESHEQEIVYGIFIFSGFLSVVLPVSVSLWQLTRPHKRAFWRAVFYAGLAVGAVLGVGFLEPAFWRG